MSSEKPDVKASSGKKQRGRKKGSGRYTDGAILAFQVSKDLHEELVKRADVLYDGNISQLLRAACNEFVKRHDDIDAQG